ncbi:MAG TPA: gamma-glutamyltransferase family protein [Acidimicrobiia bacterium]|nr:gamma-glutamyltransferase family protein [Acidimicrobiia bacterium]
MRGIVVAPQPAAVETGAAVLESGGNAFDAAIAAGYMQVVTDPFMCGLGGWGAATLYDAAGGGFEHIGFWPRIGSLMTPDMWVDDIEGFTDIWRFALFADRRNMIGYGSIMTPGTVAGFEEIHRRHASRPLAELLAPAIELSRAGFPMPEYVTNRGHQPSLPGMPHPRDKYASTPAARALFHNADGEIKRTGEPYANPDQAATLQRIATHGADDFYRGELADVIVADFEANGAFVTREDLAGYAPVIEQPLTTTYRGLEVASSAVPGGGLLTLQVLNILQQFDLAAMEHGSPDHAYVVGAALAWVGVTRGNHLTDPTFNPVPVDELMSEEHAARIADRIRRHELPDRRQLNMPGFTTHVSVIDEQGNCASITHTLTTCSGVVVPGTGFTWNDCVSLMDPIPGRPNSYIPGKARASAISPTVILRDGAPWMVVGAPGGWSISSAVSQAISNVVDFGMSPVEAVSAPRLHSEGTPVYAELRVSRRTVEAMRARGMDVVHSLHNYDPAFASVQLALVDGGVFKGGADPRRLGGAVAIARG